jgi:hypothetical protein
MGFYFRKSFRLGPLLRLNLSRSGLGLSAGVRGARIGVGPRGSYVHVGRGGLYYRQNLNSTSRPRQPSPPSPAELAEVDSGDISQMLDSSSAALLQELTRVHRRISLFPIALVLLIALTASLLLAPTLLDNATPLPKLPTETVHVSTAEVLRDRIISEKASMRVPAAWFWWLGGIVVGLGAIPLVIQLRNVDRARGTAVLRYELEPEADRNFSGLLDAFGRLASCGRVWHVRAQGATDDWKRNAGATMIVNRKTVQPAFGMPRRVSCNIDVPVLPAGDETLYFFPDRVLVYTRDGVGAVSYSGLDVSVTDVSFREDAQVPEDAQVTGSTWRFVAKSGGPDRRFSNNYEIPVVRYGEFRLTSRSGLNELFQCSKSDVAASVQAALKNQVTESEGPGTTIERRF